MTTNGTTILSGNQSHLGRWFFRPLLLIALMISTSVAFAEETADDRYLQVYRLIEQADSLGATGKEDSAKAKYREAQAYLLNFKKEHPTWNPSLVSFRLNFLSDKINPPKAPVAEPVPIIAATPKPELKPKAKPMKIAAPSSGSTAKLLSAGTEPRSSLRIHPKAGDKQTLEMTMKTAIDMGTGQTMNMPAMKVPMDVLVKSVSAEGDINYETTFGEPQIVEEPGSTPQVMQAMKASASSMKGMVMTGTMSAQGLMKNADVKIPAGAAPLMRQSLEQMKESMLNVSTPFPDEPVGAGAKWEVKMPVKSQGMTINQTTTYELASFKNEMANITSTMTQNAANQKISNPSMPQIKMDLTSMSGQGNGTITFDLTKFMPSAAKVTFQADTSMTMDMGGKKQPVNMKMDMNMQMESK